MQKFTCTMEDGSIFIMPADSWQKALLLKYGKETKTGEFNAKFRGMVLDYWKRKQVPTKFSWDDSWDEYFRGWGCRNVNVNKEESPTFKNQAELAEVVMYQMIRAALLSVAMREISKGKKSWKPQVIGIKKDGVVVYNGVKKREYKDIKEVLN